jgi:hypothetical protein
VAGIFVEEERPHVGAALLSHLAIDTVQSMKAIELDVVCSHRRCEISIDQYVGTTGTYIRARRVLVTSWSTIRVGIVVLHRLSQLVLGRVLHTAKLGLVNQSNTIVLCSDSEAI